MILFIGTFLCACSRHDTLTGSYKSRSYNIIQRYYLSLVEKSVYSIGNELELNKDSSFTYTCCGTIITGKWSVTPYTLSLFCKNNVYRNDSLNKTRPKPSCGTEPIKMHIDKSGTLTEDITSSDPRLKGLRALVYLVKVE
ncbi:MAG: hypothetical protein V4658_14215 [Bacteroidota bacterium]